MKLSRSKDFTKDEKRFIIYYTVSQVFLGTLLIALQMIFFFQVFKLFRIYNKSEGCACSDNLMMGTPENEIKQQ